MYFTGNRSFIPGKEGQVDWLHVHAGVVASGKMLKENPNTLKAVLRALRKATDAINTDREAAVKIVAREMKTDEALTRDIMALNIYSMEMNEKIPKGMGEFIDFLHSLDRIKQKFPAGERDLHEAPGGDRPGPREVEVEDRDQVASASRAGRPNPAALLTYGSPALGTLPLTVGKLGSPRGLARRTGNQTWGRLLSPASGCHRPPA